ncbi:hypothetical protein [Streptomyces sp. NPDC001292]|uniref:hypothetical protein n=1 Tax=Streptomyces sp. NPDC001292 TaxID=3364558 RepID=UPI0036C997FB
MAIVGAQTAAATGEQENAQEGSEYQADEALRVHVHGVPFGTVDDGFPTASMAQGLFNP